MPLNIPARFCLAGIAGFLVDAAVLYVLMTGIGVPPLVGRFVSFLCAAFVTWRINRSFTFGARTAGRGSVKELLHYLWASAVGALANYGTFAILIMTLRVVASHPTIGVAAGSAAGMSINFTLYSGLVFPRRNSPSAR